MKRILMSTLLGLALVWGAPASAADDGQVDIVASFSILADMVRQVGGEYVDVTSLVGRNGDAHTYSPTPTAARAVATADLVVVNGLGFEGWLNRLVQASGYDGPIVVATQGIEVLRNSDSGRHHTHPEHDHHHHGEGHHNEHHHHHGVFNPHAWFDASRGMIYIRNITDALVKVDPEHAETYRSRADKYIERLGELHAEIKAMVAALPEDRRTVVVPHAAFGYFADAYGIHFLAPVGLSTADAAGAGEVAALIRRMQKENIDASFVENISNSLLMQQIANEIGLTIGSKLYTDALSAKDGPASTYIELLRYDAGRILNALSGSHQSAS